MPSKKHQSAIESNNAFMVKMEDLVKEIIISNNIPYYRIESRMDDQSTSGENNYMPIVRVITYFEDSVSKISDIISAEFDIDDEHSVDKKKVRLDSFSYKHIQYIATLKPARQDLIEYRRSGDKQFEIQVCSMLQDAWAGIEKELGYDNETFPEEMKRDFYRVGALLEMADLEFLKIRSQLSVQTGLLEQSKENEAIQDSADDITLQQLHDAEGNDEEHNQLEGEHTEGNGQEQQMQQPYYPQYGMPQEYINGYPAMNGMPMNPNYPYYPQPNQPYPQQYMNGANGMPNGYMQPQPIFNNGVFQGYMPAPMPGQPFMPGQPYYPQQQIPGQPFQPQQPTPVTDNKNNTAKQQPEKKTPAAPKAEPKAEAKVEPKTEQTASKTNGAIAATVAAAVAVPVVAEVIAKVTEPVEAAIAPVAEAINTNQQEAKNIASSITNGVSLDTIDMNVDKPNTLAMNVNSIENTNGIENGGLPDMVAGSPVNLPVEAGNTGLIPETSTPASGLSDSVALNIDKIETFNMNVNGMIERHTEVIIDKSAKDESIPFYDREPIPVKSNMLDENAQMTDPMLKEYVNNSKLVKDVDAEIAIRSGASLNSDVDVEGDVERLKFLKVYTLKQLHEKITDNKDDIIAFAEKWIGSDNGGSFDSGICLFYLEYLLVGKKNDPAFAVEYVLKFISDNDYSARFIIPTYNSISKNDKPIGAHLTLK